MEIGKIFQKLNNSPVRYVLFTGNLNIDRAFNGKGDFDILVDRKNNHELESILLGIGFKRRVSTFNNFFFGVDNYLFYDIISEKMFHFHIHYSVIFGFKHELNHHIKDPIIYFKNSTKQTKFNIPIVTPEIEYIILVLNILAFQNTKTRIKKFLNLKTKNKQILKHKGLIKIISEEKLDKTLDFIFKEFKNEVKTYYKKGDINGLKSFFLEATIRKKLITYQRVGGHTNKLFSSIRKKIKHKASHSLSTNGMVISLIGADGAGKTTLSKEIMQWLNYKLTAKNMFLGQKKSSKLNWVLRKCAKILKLCKLKKLAKIIKDFTHIINATYREKGVILANFLSQRGYYVVTDRYPLKEFWNMDLIMDGPKLEQESYLYNKERGIYTKIKDYPDLIIILKIPIETSINRKPEEHNNERRINNLIKKIEAISSIESLPNTFVVDATKNYDYVKKEVKSIIWKNI